MPSTPAPRSRFFISARSRKLTTWRNISQIGRRPVYLAAYCRPAVAGLPTVRFLFAAIIIFVFSSNLYSQTETKIIGQIIDQVSGAPIPGAIITIQGQGRNTVSDAQGQFYFNDLPIGNYRLSAERIGYENLSAQNVNVDEITPAPIMLRMNPNVIEVPGQTVIEAKSSPFFIRSNGNTTVIDIAPGNLESIEMLANQIPEIEVVDSGPRKLLRIRGAQLNGTTVMLDGRVINSTLTSEGDVSAIPLKAVSKIEIVKGGSYKSQGLAGSVNFITDSNIDRNVISSSGERGSYGLESYSFQFAQKHPNGSSAEFEMEDSYDRGDFKFVDPRDSIEIRKNNFAHSLNLFGRFGYSHKTININLNGHYFKRDSGVPGPIFQYTPEAKSNSTEKEIYSRIEKEFAAGLAMEIVAGASNRDATYDSPATAINFIPYKTNFKEDSRDIKVQMTRKGRVDFNSYFGLRYESLNGADLIRPSYSFGRHSRIVNTLAAGAVIHLPRAINLNKESSFAMGIRRDGGDNGDFWAPSGSLRINFNLPFNPGVDVSAFRSRRLPDLTDLYWKEDVFATPNADLKPEKSTGYDIGFDFHVETKGDYKIRASRYVTDYDDIIIWRRWSGDKFKPVNLSKASISGRELSLDANPFLGPLIFFWNASFIRPLNKEPEPTHYNKYLTFRPIGTQSAGLEFKYQSLDLKLVGRHIGCRYVTEENTKSLSSVDLLECYAGYRIALWSFSLTPSLSILNIGNIQYQILDGQPEKPREFRVKLELSKNGGIF